MSIQARLAAEYVNKIKKLLESRAIDPATSKTMKDLKLKVVTCVSSKIMHFFSGHHDGLEIALYSKYFSFYSSVPSQFHKAMKQFISCPTTLDVSPTR